VQNLRKVKKMLKLIKKSNQAGVTLLETILVLSLIAIIMVGGLNLYRSASNSAKATDAMRNLVSLATNVKALYGSQFNFLDLDNEVIIDAGLVPPGMSISGTSISNTFGGAVVIDAGVALAANVVAGSGSLTDRSYVDDETFTVVYPQVPKSVCYKIVTTDIGQVGGPLDPADVSTTACSADSNTLTFYFYK